MTTQQQSIIKGCYRMGATIEQICFELKIDGLEVQKVLEHFITQETFNYVENERYNILKNFSRENKLCTA